MARRRGGRGGWGESCAGHPAARARCSTPRAHSSTGAMHVPRPRGLRPRGLALACMRRAVHVALCSSVVPNTYVPAAPGRPGTRAKRTAPLTAAPRSRCRLRSTSTARPRRRRRPAEHRAGGSLAKGTEHCLCVGAGAGASLPGAEVRNPPPTTTTLRGPGARAAACAGPHRMHACVQHTRPRKHVARRRAIGTNDTAVAVAGVRVVVVPCHTDHPLTPPPPPLPLLSRTRRLAIGRPSPPRTHLVVRVQLAERLRV